MPWHKDEVTEVITPSKDFQYLGGFRNAVVVVNNLVARSTTRWTLEEAKLFMLAVSQIEQRDEDCWVRLRKKTSFRLWDWTPESRRIFAENSSTSKRNHR